MNIYILQNHFIQLEDEEGNILIKTKSWKRLEKKMQQELEEREKEKMCTYV